MTINKLIWALVGATAFGLQGGLSDGHLDTVELIGFVGMLLTALGTWIVPNTPVLEKAKTWVAALVVGTGVLVPHLVDGWQISADLWPVVIAVLTSAGVYVVPNRSQLAPAG